MNKRTLLQTTTVILVVLICAFVSTLMVSAETAAEPTLILSDFQTVQGAEFSTSLTLAEGSNICSFQIALEYDTELVTLVSAEENDDAGGSVIVNSTTPGEIDINYARVSSNTSAERAVVDLVFRVDGNIGVGIYDLLTEKTDVTKRAGRFVNSSVVEVPLVTDFSKLNIYGAGDVDLSNEVNIFDVTHLRRHLVRLETLSDYQLIFGDAYYDKVVNIVDATHIQRKIARYEVNLGNRINVNFYDSKGNLYVTKSVMFGDSLDRLPKVPALDGYSDGQWSAESDRVVSPNLEELEADINVYAVYGGRISEAMAYYKRILTTSYYSGDLSTGLSGDLNLVNDLIYEGNKTAKVYWSSSNNATLNASTGSFSRPTYDSNLKLTATVVSYENGIIESSDTIDFDYSVVGVYQTPAKSAVTEWLQSFFGAGDVNYNVKLPQKLTNVELNSDHPYELRINWEKNDGGAYVPISEITRDNTSKVYDLVATVTFNGKPLEDDGKVYLDDIPVAAIELDEVRAKVIDEIAAHVGLTATEGSSMWPGTNPSNGTPYNATIRWISKNTSIATVNNNVIHINNTAINGTVLPLAVQVTYATDNGAKTFELSYNISVVTNNTTLVPGTNIDKDLYDALKAATDIHGDLTTEALKDNQFVYLDLSGYPDIQDLSGLSYCKNLRVLNISGLRVKRGINEISTLNKLEALIARDCGLDNLTDGGVPVLKNAISLRLLDLSYNNFTNLDSVFAEGVKYGQLREVYLNDNNLQDISTLSRAPAMMILALSNNGLTTEKIQPLANYKYLTYLSLADNDIDSITALKDLKYLLELRLQNNRISDVRDLKKLTSLKALYLGGNNIRSNIDFLDYLTDLRLLYLNDNQIEDISGLISLENLESINVSGNKIDTLSVLERYSNTLEEVYAEKNEIASFSFVKNLTKLRVLMLANNIPYVENSLTEYLSGLTSLQTLTLSGKPVSDLSFINGMTELTRLDVDNCQLPAYLVTSSLILTNDETGRRTLEISEYQDNLGSILNRKSTLKYLNISNNNLAYYTSEILDYMREQQGININVDGITFTAAFPTSLEALYEMNKIVVLYADNIHKNVDASALTPLMTDLKYLSLENCGITDMSWLSKFRNLVFVDLAGNSFDEVDLGAFISAKSKSSLKYLYLDTNAQNAEFKNAYRTFDENVLEELSLKNITIPNMSYMPYMDHLRYLDISNTGLTNLNGTDPDFYDVHSILRYQQLNTLDVTDLQADISMLTDLNSLQTLYANAIPSDQIFYNTDITTLYNLYNKGVTCYLYNYNDTYTPVAATEGTKILGELKDISGTIKVAADNVISDLNPYSNPYLEDKINDFDITWTVSNDTNYEIVDHHLSVKDYTCIADEALTLTASINVYPNQPPVTRDFTINTNIIRVGQNVDYYNRVIDNFDDFMERQESFTYDITLKEAITEGFSNPVKPVEDNIVYKYRSHSENGEDDPIPYANILVLGDNHSYSIKGDATLNSVTTITVRVGHNAVTENGMTFVVDDEIVRSFTIKGRVFTVNYVMNDGKVIASDGSEITSQKMPEDTLMFQNVTISRTGYIFDGFYLDDQFTSSQKFYSEGDQVIMPSNDITLYAKWIPHSFNLIFDANEGQVDTQSKIVLCDEPFGELPTPSRDYYDFVGWFTEPEGGTEITSESTAETAEDITAYAHWSRHEPSDWVLESEVPEGAEILEEKWTYDLTTNITSDKEEVEGYTLYNTTWVWSEYGPWSAWSRTQYYPSDSRKVESRYFAEQAKTQYNYNKFTQYSNGTGSNGPKEGTWGGNYCRYEHWRGWSDSPLGVWSTQYSNQVGGYFNLYGSSGDTWYNQQTRRVVTQPAYTEWRYCDRHKIYTYYHTKTESKESNTEITASDTISNVQKWVKYRAK